MEVGVFWGGEEYSIWGFWGRRIDTQYDFTSDNVKIFSRSLCSSLSLSLSLFLSLSPAKDLLSTKEFSIRSNICQVSQMCE
jgi:hypothetical protein